MKPVLIPRHAFAFCRYTVAVLVWAALWWRSVWLLGLVALLLGLSAALKVRRAPLIVLYAQTIGRLHRSRNEVVEETAMRFAHIAGTILAACCLLAIWLNPVAGWRLTLVFAVLKTVSALGFCPASKLFTCATNTTCCPLTKKFLGVCQPQAGPPQHK